MTAADQPPLIIFDVCDTLYDTNTMVGFLAFLAERPDRHHLRAALNRWSNRRSPWFYVGAALHRLAGLDLARLRLIRALAGEQRIELESIARAYVGGALARSKNEKIHQRLEEHRQVGHRIVLVSSSIDVVIAAIADRLQVEFRASELRFEAGICTGQLACDLTGRKAAAVQQLCGSVAPACVYTDNQSDRDLLEIAQKGCIILPSHRSQRPWGGSHHEHIEL